MKRILLVGCGLFMSGYAPGAWARPVECACYYLSRESGGLRWEYLARIRLDAERGNYEQRGERVCKAKAQAEVLDSTWKGSVSVDSCRFVN